MKIALSRGSSSFQIFRLCALAFVALVLAAPAYANAAEVAVTPSLNVASFVALANSDRAAYGVSALSEDVLLNIAAQKKANDMVARGYFAHIGPNGQKPWHWFISTGYYYMNAGENLAMNFEDTESIERAWMLSPAHRANIVNPLYTKMGIGIARGVYQGKQTTFVVQFFAKPVIVRRQAPALTPRIVGWQL